MGLIPVSTEGKKRHHGRPPLASSRCSPLLLGLCAFVSSAGPVAGAISVEDRSTAQEEIERVYYRHRTGSTSPFEQAVRRDVLQAKILDYLRKSAALQEIWGELARIERDPASTSPSAMPSGPTWRRPTRGR